MPVIRLMVQYDNCTSFVSKKVGGSLVSAQTRAMLYCASHKTAEAEFERFGYSGSRDAKPFKATGRIVGVSVLPD